MKLYSDSFDDGGPVPVDCAFAALDTAAPRAPPRPAASGMA